MENEQINEQINESAEQSNDILEESSGGETTQINVDPVPDSSSSINSSDQLTIDEATRLLSIMNEVISNDSVSRSASSEDPSEGSSEDSSEGSSDLIDFIDYSSYLSSIQEDLVRSNEYASSFCSFVADYQINNNLQSNIDDISLTNMLLVVLMCVGLLIVTVQFIRSIF